MSLLDSIHVTTAQQVAEQFPHRIPDKYVRPIDERPISSPASYADQIPVLDLAGLDDVHKRRMIVQAIGQACESWGFFQVVNHGISAPVIQNMLKAAQDFFSMHADERMVYYTTDLHKQVSYGTSFNPSLEKYLQWRDYLLFPGLPFPDVMNVWPEKPPNFRIAALEYCKEVINLKRRLLAAISESLGLESDYLDKALGEQTLRHMINYYPVCPNPDLALGIASHSDIDIITVLLQEQVQGLQLFIKDRWVGVQPIPEALVINVCDCLEIMTNGKYRSVEHRVVPNQQSSRISIASFCGPSLNAIIGPVPELLDSQQSAVYKQVKFADYLDGFFSRRLEGKSTLDMVKVGIN